MKSRRQWRGPVAQHYVIGDTSSRWSKAKFDRYGIDSYKPIAKHFVRETNSGSKFSANLSGE